MTEEGIKVLLKPELTKAKKGMLRRSSIVNPSSQYIAGNIRRNSTGKSNSLNAGEEVNIPNHLRASTGSCHDFCKYGRKHEFEPTIKQHIQVERKKIAASKVSPDSSDVRSSDPPEIIKREVKVEALSKQKSLDLKIEALSKKKSSALSKQKSLDFKVEALSKQKSSALSKQKSSDFKVEALSKQKSSASSKQKSSDFGIVVKPKGLKPILVPEKKKLPSSLNVSVSRNGGRESDIVKAGKGTSVLVKKLRPSPTISLPTKSSVGRAIKSNPRKPLSAKVSPPLKDQNLKVKTAKTESGPEKTLHVVESEIKNDDLKFVQIPSPKALTDPSSSALSSLTEEDITEESEYTDTESEDEIVNIDEAKASNGHNVGNRRKSEEVISEDKGKAKFRRGKVIDLESEKNGPRKLRFRRGRILGDNEVDKGDNRRRRFKKRGIDEDASKDSNNNSEKVILRHQDSQEKKDAQGLFNNVIEETANKLAETRKSKVKALVGAFETVISLQETSKSHTPTPTSSPSES